MTPPSPLAPKPTQSQQPPPITTEQLQAWIMRRARFRSRIKTFIVLVLVVCVGGILIIWTLFHEQLIAKGRLEAVGFTVDWEINPAVMLQGGVTSVYYTPRWNLGDRVTANDLKMFQSLLHLTALDLGALDMLNDEDLAVLANLKELTDLQLHRSPVFHRKEARIHLTDAVIDHIKGLTQLKTLSLADNRITDAGVSKLANLTELESLDLDNTQITDASLESLKALKKLKFLRVVNTQVSHAGVAAFQRLMTNTEVTSEEIPLGLDQ